MKIFNSISYHYDVCVCETPTFYIYFVLALTRGHHNAVKYLVKKGVNLNETFPDGKTVLHKGIKNDCFYWLYHT